MCQYTIMTRSLQAHDGHLNHLGKARLTFCSCMFSMLPNRMKRLTEVTAILTSSNVFQHRFHRWIRWLGVSPVDAQSVIKTDREDWEFSALGSVVIEIDPSEMTFAAKDMVEFAHKRTPNIKLEFRRRIVEEVEGMKVKPWHQCFCPGFYAVSSPSTVKVLSWRPIYSISGHLAKPLPRAVIPAIQIPFCTIRTSTSVPYSAKASAHSDAEPFSKRLRPQITVWQLFSFSLTQLGWRK